MNLLKEFLLDDKCSYLDGKEQTTHYKVIDNCSAASCENLIERGYRRFGKMYFRPICATCTECQSIKIDVKNFEFSKSAKRVINKSKNIRTFIQTPSITQEHLDLFDKYHLYMHDKKDWNYSKTTAQHYYNSFVTGHGNFGFEVLYYDDDKLIAVDLIDILQSGISSIYFYYDPDYAKYSLGKLSLYHQIKYAKSTNKKWIYLGYYVKECPSLSYKSQYTPYVTLQGRPNEHEEFKWF